MYTRLSAVLPVAALAAVVAAAPGALEVRGVSECNTGSIQCCNQVLSQSDPTITQLAGLLGIALPSVGLLGGINCTPITIVGTGTGAVCTQQPICCTDNTYNGLLNLGCSPINLNA